MLRFSGVQGVALASGSVLHLVSLYVVAAFLGAADLGRFAILYFGAGLLSQLLLIAVKPGTIRRTFGAEDDEDEDEEEEEVSRTPARSLGTGLVLALIVTIVGVATAILLRTQIADLLLGSREDADLVMWAALLGGVTVIYRLASIIIWFERRAGAFLIVELSRPVLALSTVTALLAAGAGLEAVLIGQAAGATAAAIVGIVILKGSFDPAFDGGEVKRILHRGMLRAPIMTSFWVMGNADVFLLSRFVDHTELGIYTLASRIGFIAGFLPQGFRVALRPLRKATIYRAVEEQYGRSEQRGQLLGYFVLLCISATLAMALLGGLLVRLAPSSFTDAAPLIPLAAAAMVMPPLLRTVNHESHWRGKTRRTFVASAVLAALLFIGLTLLLAPEIGNYAAPVGMIGGLLVPSVYIFVRCQRGPAPIGFPYREVSTAFALALALGGGFALLPDLAFALEALAATAFGAAYLGGLFVLRVVPESHWPALTHMTRSLVSGRPDRFNPRRGLRRLQPRRRADLRSAVQGSWACGGGASVPTGDAAARLVKILRRAGARGGAQVGEPSDLDAQIGSHLFSDLPTADRNATMRKLLEDGADAADLRTLEDLVAHLAKVPEGAWEGARKRDSDEDGSGSAAGRGGSERTGVQ